jgi:hypothetical protein
MGETLYFFPASVLVQTKLENATVFYRQGHHLRADFGMQRSAYGKFSRSVAFLLVVPKTKLCVFSVLCLASSVQTVGTVGGKTRRGSL